MQRVLVIAAALAACEAPALTIHRSFGSRDVGFGGGVGVSVPIDSRASAALDEGRAKAAERAKVYVGRVTRVLSGSTVCIVTGGGTRVPVRLDRIDAPAPDQPHGKEAVDFLKKLIHGRQVRVEYRERDEKGLVLGVVTFGKTDANMKMVAAGLARYVGEDGKDSPYVAAEAAARAEKKGIWSDEG